jgi:hypothetical protein
LVELLDGDGDAVCLWVGRAYEALVDAPEAALAELLRAAEVGRGGLQRRVLERAQLAVAPLLVQRRDAVLRRRAPRLAHGAHRRARVVGAARAAHRRRRGGRGRRHGRAARPRGARALGPPVEAAEAAHLSPARYKLGGPRSFSALGEGTRIVRRQGIGVHALSTRRGTAGHRKPGGERRWGAGKEERARHRVEVVVVAVPCGGERVLGPLFVLDGAGARGVFFASSCCCGVKRPERTGVIKISFQSPYTIIGFEWSMIDSIKHLLFLV